MDGLFQLIKLTLAYNFIGFIQQKIMNQLDFSPISQKEQQSIDTFSFLHHPSHLHRNKVNQQWVEGGKKIFERLCRATYNRQSYGFQLLKQFILFSSDEETIEIHYKYTQFQLEQGIEHLENSYGMHVKLTVGKALQDIKNYSKKKKTYQNPAHIQKLTSVYNKIINLRKQQTSRWAIKILAKFIHSTTLESILQIQPKQQSTNQQINTLERLMELSDPSERLRALQYSAASSRKFKNYNQLTQSKYRKRKDLMKTAKYSNQSSERQQNSHSNWKQEVEDVDSYQQQPQDSPQIIIKSMSNQLGVYPSTDVLDSTRHHNRTGLRQNKCISTQITPLQLPKQSDVYRTKKKYQQGSIYKSSSSQIQKLDVTQNVVIIRSSKKHKREPDRYIRVPIISQKVKIIELLPDEDKRQKDKQQKHMIKTLSSRQKLDQNERKISSKSSRNYEWKKQDYKIKQNLKKLESSHHEKSYRQLDSQNCIGCKYCSLVKQMESYRLKRAKGKPLNFI